MMNEDLKLQHLMVCPPIKREIFLVKCIQIAKQSSVSKLYNLVWFDQIVNYYNLWIGAMGDRNADIKDLTDIIGNALFESFQLVGFLQQTEKNTG